MPRAQTGQMKQSPMRSAVIRTLLPNIRQRFVEHGLEAALARRKREDRPRLVDGEVEAQDHGSSVQPPPEGRSGWTLRLLADKLVELEIVPSISHETV